VKSRSRSLAVYNNEFILRSACVGSENHCESTKSLKIVTCLTLIVSTLRSCCIQCPLLGTLSAVPYSSGVYIWQSRLLADGRRRTERLGPNNGKCMQWVDECQGIDQTRRMTAYRRLQTSVCNVLATYFGTDRKSGPTHERVQNRRVQFRVSSTRYSIIFSQKLSMG